MPYIRLDQIEFSIGTQVMLDKVNLTLDKGDRLGLLGRNGAGKSTLMRILSGELVPGLRLLDGFPGDGHPVVDGAGGHHGLEVLAALLRAPPRVPTHTLLKLSVFLAGSHS